MSIGAEKCLTLGISKSASEQISILREKCARVSGFTYSRDSERVFEFLKILIFFTKKLKFYFLKIKFIFLKIKFIFFKILFFLK